MNTLTRHPTRLSSPGQRWASYQEIVPTGVPLSIVMSWAYWQKVADYLRPFDEIDVIAEDGSFDAKIRLLRKTSDSMTFHLARNSFIEGAVEIRRESCEGMYRVVNGTGGFAVRKTENGQIVADGLDKDAAEAERRRLIELAAAA